MIVATCGCNSYFVNLLISVDGGLGPWFNSRCRQIFFLFQPHWIYIVTLHKGGPSTEPIPFSMGDTGASCKSFNDARWRLLSYRFSRPFSLDSCSIMETRTYFYCIELLLCYRNLSQEVGESGIPDSVVPVECTVLLECECLPPDFIEATVGAGLQHIVAVKVIQNECNLSWQFTSQPKVNTNCTCIKVWAMNLSDRQ